MWMIEIPCLPPTSNHAWGQSGKRRFKSREYTAFETVVAFCKGKGELPPAEIPLKVQIDIYNNWIGKEGQILKKDLDNKIKCCIDPIFRKLGIDDSHVFDIKARKIHSREKKTRVWVTTWDHEIPFASPDL